MTNAPSRPEKPKGWPFTVAVVNETFVKRFFGGQNPVGRHLGLGGDPGTSMPARLSRRRRKGHALRRRSAKRSGHRCSSPIPAVGIEGLTIYVRTGRAPADDAMRAVRQQIAALDSTARAVRRQDRRPPHRAVRRQRAPDCQVCQRLELGMATLLAVIGLYGVLAYSVTLAHARDRNPDGARRVGAQIASHVLLEAAAMVGYRSPVGRRRRGLARPLRRESTLWGKAGRRPHRRRGGDEPCTGRRDCRAAARPPRFRRSHR